MAGSDQVNLSESKKVVPLNTWVLISNFKVAYHILRRPDGTFDRHLAEFLDRKVPSNANPVDGVFSFDVVIDRATSLLCRVYRPANGDHQQSLIDLEKPIDSEILPVILFFHGGSFTHSSVNSSIYDTLCRRLVGVCHCIVVSVNYRRAPENPYPCAYDDGWTALQWVNSRSWLKSKKDSKVHIFLAGDSSGGNIIHNVALRASEESGIEILGNILLNPMFGGNERTESEKRLDGKYFVTLRDRDWYWRAFLPDGEDRDHPACNPFGPRGKSLEGMKFPKSLVVVAGLDLIQDWQLAYVRGLRNAGQEVKLQYLERATIGFYLLPNNNHFHTVMDEINAFVNADRQ
ncbi:PREDICTED: gibberellin receptor GID1A-like [Tarenaya hassleriana]|uniref:gibberellin receptor GID1A-like n=1 Tax=Tarenaya hassleriana TaxID=28532 RepID=UPI00053C8675|nr:PREDICTED: gibberellin receptor GID1A-like [Tarenaya hassleriana]